jgi:hypothetical protein
MSVPTIITDPSTFQSSFTIATPFEYTLSNSDVAPPGVVIDGLSYTGSGVEVTSLATSNTSVSVSISNYTGATLTGLAYTSADSNILRESDFNFTLPSNLYGGTMSFLQGIGVEYISNGLIRFYGSSNTNSYFVDSLDSRLTHIQQATDGVFDVVFAQGVPGSNLVETTIATDFQVPILGGVQFQLSNPLWTGYGEWTDIDGTQYRVDDKVSYLGLNYNSLQNANGGNRPDVSPTWWALVEYPSNLRPSFTINAPVRRTAYPTGFPLLTLGSLTSASVIPFVSGNGSYQLNFASAFGFQTAPLTSQVLQVIQSISGLVIGTTTYTFNVSNISIDISPTFTNPLSLISYEPFGVYTYSIPDTVVNVNLQYNSNTTSSLLVPYITNGETEYTLTFGSTVGLPTGGLTTIEIDAVLNGNTIIVSNVKNLITTATTIVATPSIPTRSLSLYKYEPFSYTFTFNQLAQGLSFRTSRSSSELQTFITLSEDLKTATFAGTYGVSFSTTLNLIVDLMFGSTIVDTQTILVSVGPGRFFPPSANQNFQLFQYEDISNTFGSNPSFLTVLPITSIISVPSLPSGLTFGGSCNTFFLQGTPILRVNQSNYQIIGSNSSNGKIVTSIISIRVNEQLVRITPSASTLSNLTVDTAITPITSTAVQPPTIYYSTFNYTWSGLPDGFTFQNSLGSNVSQPFSPADSALTIILAGTPTLAFATSLSTSNSNLYQTRLTGSRIDQTGKQITGSSLFNFSMAETVLINVSNSVTLYRSKPLGTTDVLITAGSFFSTATISSVTATSLPPGLSLVLDSGPNVYRLSGTPTEVNLVGSYTFTATNTNGTSRSVTATIPINPNVVTFGGSSPANGTVIRFIVSRSLTNAKTGYYTTPIIFSATSTANATPIVYTSSIDFTTYGLVLNSSTGTLTGIPTTTLSSTTVTITATDTLGTTGTTTIQLSILADEFTWSTYTPTYFQNRAITSFQFIAISTLSERPIQSYSSTDLPTGLVISAGGLLSGTPTEFPGGGTGSFTITASTGFTITNQVYNYSMIADQLLIIQTNGSDSISQIFSGIEYRAIQYSSDSFVNATFSIGTLSPATSATIAVTSGGLVSGDFTTAALNTTYSATLTAVFGTVTATTPIYILFTTSGGSIRIPTELSTLTFSQPTQTTFTLFEYVSYSIPIQAIGSGSFIYYYTSAIPLGFQFLKDSSGLTSTLSGISPILSNQGIIVYAKTAAGYAISISLTLRTITPFFINPQIGAAAYTAILRNDVEGNAAQNARDNRTFPQVDPLAGPLMAPRAPDVVTPNDCILKLCKKPCPTCRTMM